MPNTLDLRLYTANIVDNPDKVKNYDPEIAVRLTAEHMTNKKIEQLRY